jgi:hypothetical protein
MDESCNIKTQASGLHKAESSDLAAGGKIRRNCRFLANQQRKSRPKTGEG